MKNKMTDLWDSGYPVDMSVSIPAHTPLMFKDHRGQIVLIPEGFEHPTVEGTTNALEYRSLEPLVVRPEAGTFHRIAESSDFFGGWLAQVTDTGKLRVYDPANGGSLIGYSEQDEWPEMVPVEYVQKREPVSVTEIARVIADNDEDGDMSWYLCKRIARVVMDKLSLLSVE